MRGILMLLVFTGIIFLERNLLMTDHTITFVTLNLVFAFLFITMLVGKDRSGILATLAILFGYNLINLVAVTFGSESSFYLIFYIFLLGLTNLVTIVKISGGGIVTGISLVIFSVALSVGSIYIFLFFFEKT
ncbi:MAG: hypothetical protein HZA36_03485 [Parcubacteria group bacterium]|nr:hypothetical protein [Parcubacteria group bacterium]